MCGCVGVSVWAHGCVILKCEGVSVCSCVCLSLPSAPLWKRPRFAGAAGALHVARSIVSPCSHGFLLESPEPLPRRACRDFAYVCVCGISWWHAHGLATSNLQAKKARREKPEWQIERELDEVCFIPASVL